MLQPSKTKQFEKDHKKAKKQDRDFDELLYVMNLLIKEISLDVKYKDHHLKGKWVGCRDCHMQNDWVLIYRINKENKTILFERIGSHSEYSNNVYLINQRSKTIIGMS
ncbi:MAG: type II toxin-antitoxin system YafQ family toxin [Parachlamydiaceae bacterium]|nr:type II toxin-antitoxin system YafQ family toxin [Parachlamydiaceae bacterium]